MHEAASSREETCRSVGSFLGRNAALLGKVKQIMNEANSTVREAARDLAVEILGAVGVQPQGMDSTFGEGSIGAALELRLTRFAGAILEQAKPKPPPKVLPRALGDIG
jgi:hypothetical protein